MTDITVTVTITPQQICDQLCAAFECGANYWLQSATLLSSPEGQVKKEGLVWYGQEHLYGPGLQFQIEYDNPSSGPDILSRTLTWDDLIKGLEVMAVKCPEHWADLVNETGDASTGDVYLQCVLFGEVIYG